MMRLRRGVHQLPLQIRQIGVDRLSSGKVIANGKTAQEIIAEAQAKGNPKLSWKERAKKAGEYASMGAGH